MAQISFFMTEDETYSIVQFLIDEFKAQFTPEKNSDLNFPVFQNINDIKNNKEVSGYKRYFVTSKNWGNYPFIFKELNLKGYHYFYIDLHYGGPSFDLIFPRTFEENGKRWIIAGMISDFPLYYLDNQHTTTIKRPVAMAEAYKKITKYIKKGGSQSIHTKGRFKGPIISAEVLKEFQAGTLKIGYNNDFTPIEKG